MSRSNKNLFISLSLLSTGKGCIALNNSIFKILTDEKVWNVFNPTLKPNISLKFVFRVIPPEWIDDFVPEMHSMGRLLCILDWINVISGVLTGVSRRRCCRPAVAAPRDLCKLQARTHLFICVRRRRARTNSLIYAFIYCFLMKTPTVMYLNLG